MLDIQFIREHPELVAEKSKQKGYDVDIPRLLELDNKRRAQLAEIEILRKQRNEHAQVLKGQRPTEQQLEAGRHIKEAVAEQEARLQQIEHEYMILLKDVPNMPLDDVPVGNSEADNVISKVVGEPKRFNFNPKNHAEIAEHQGWIDKERAAKIAGSRFAYIKGNLALLQFAIVQFVLRKLTDQSFLEQIITENGLQVSNKAFVPVLPPLLIRENIF